MKKPDIKNHIYRTIVLCSVLGLAIRQNPRLGQYYIDISEIPNNGSWNILDSMIIFLIPVVLIGMCIGDIIYELILMNYLENRRKTCQESVI